eukprot:2457644-Amphidinium_carterae.1
MKTHAGCGLFTSRMPTEHVTAKAVSSNSTQVFAFRTNFPKDVLVEHSHPTQCRVYSGPGRFPQRIASCGPSGQERNFCNVATTGQDDNFQDII